ncbi:MAG TPA: hypothetical protein VFX07_11145 [Candidatus Udaeobacter sp.]|jgi:hypothetical protein|nr:hypothetical protein [Candidatus Udaeobacter sp.]
MPATSLSTSQTNATKGLQRHIEDLKAMFAYAPDIHVQGHPVKFGSDHWTCVIGTMAGTFTKPMPTGRGKTIPPTGKRFRIDICMGWPLE